MYYLFKDDLYLEEINYTLVETDFKRYVKVKIENVIFSRELKGLFTSLEKADEVRKIVHDNLGIELQLKRIDLFKGEE